jgi:murein DD-endopeptidase MepM/ murein hydrolase activator NlpD
VLLISVCLFSNITFAASEKKQKAPTPQKTATPKKSVAKKPVATPAPRLGAQPVYKQNRFNSYPLNNPQNDLGEPLPTPNIIENILKTPSVEVVKPSSNIQRFSFKHGCGQVSNSMANFLKNIALQDQEFLSAFDRQVPQFFSNLKALCIPYAYSLDNNTNKIQAFSILNNEKRDKSTTLVTLNRSPNTEGFLVSSQQIGSQFENFLELTLDLNDLVVYKANQANTSIPPELIWELGSLVKELYPKINSNEKHFARVVYDTGGKDQWAQVISLEILDQSQKHVVADAFWVSRDDLPGGFFTSYGLELEQHFWINPLNYTRISRGVGNFAYTSRRPAVVKKGKKNVVVLQSYTSYSGHQGIDFAAPPGTPIYGVANGKIVHYSPYAGYGNLVIIEHPGNYKTYYAHLSAFNPELSVGSEVRRGLEIGYVGSTGFSTGPHLHFELRKNGGYLNPLSNGLELDLWTLSPFDQNQLTNNIVLFSSFLK